MLLSFDDFVLDTDSYELRKNGQRCAIEPMVFDLLAHLAQHPNRIFTRDELINHVWSGRVVADTTVSTCIKSARKALDDDGQAQRYIQTVRGRGFRFNAQTNTQQAGVQRTLSTARQSAAELLDGDPTLLILPFTSMSTSADSALLAQTLTLDLNAILTRIPLLKLSTQASRYSQLEVAPTPREIHEDTGIDFVLEGRTQQVGNAFRINVQLANARSGFSLWAKRLRISAPIESAVDEAVTAVVANLEPQLNRAIYTSVREFRHEPSARSLYLESNSLLSVHGYHHESFAQAAELLRKARQLDPHFALAAAQLALVMGFGKRVGLTVDRDEAAAEALESAESSLALDRTDSTVLGYSGCALADIGFVERGAPILRNAIELEPANAQAWVALGSCSLLRGELQESVEQLTHGISISPLDSRLSIWGAVLGIAHMMSGDLNCALAQSELACQRDHRTYMPRIVLAAVHLVRGDPVRSSQALSDAHRIFPDLSARQITALVGKDIGPRLAKLL